MSFIQWFLLVEDILLMPIMIAFFFLRKIPYTIASILGLVILAYINIVLLQGNRYYLLILVPSIAYGFMMLIASGFTSRERNVVTSRTSKAIALTLLILTLLLVIAGIILFFKVFSK